MQKHIFILGFCACQYIFSQYMNNKTMYVDIYFICILDFYAHDVNILYLTTNIKMFY